MNGIKIVGKINDGHINGQIRSGQVSGKINVGGGGVKEVETNTTEWWNSHPNIIAKMNTIYVYSDYKQVEGQDLPGIKIGDGKAYLIDMPFIDVIYSEHVEDTDIHVTLDEKAFWNEKVRCYISDLNNERIIFTTN